jgi:hypothetical protein
MVEPLDEQFAKEHEAFLKANHPRLHRSLSRSGKLQDRVEGVGIEAASQYNLEMSRKHVETKDLDPLAREKALRHLHESMMELVRHDLIHQPIPQPQDE